MGTAKSPLLDSSSANILPNETRHTYRLQVSGVQFLLVALCLVVFIAPSIPPLQDYNEWLYQAYLIKYKLVHSLSGVAFKAWPVPNSIAQIGMALLTWIMPPILAGKFFIGTYIVFGAILCNRLSARYFYRSRASIVFPLTALVCLPPSLWAGEINYQIGIYVLCWYLFLVSPSQKVSFWRDASVGVLLFFCHAICLGIYCIFVIARGHQTRSLARSCLIVLGPCVLLLCYLYWNPHHENTEAELVPHLSGIKEAIAYRFYILCKLGPYQNLVLADSGDYFRLPIVYLFGIAVNIVFGLCIGSLIVGWVLRSLYFRQCSSIVLTASACVMLYVWDPAKLLWVATLGERFLLPAAIAALLLYQGLAPVRRLATICSFCLLALLPYNAYTLLTAHKGRIVDLSINNPDMRYKLLFWHRPYLFGHQAELADQSARELKPPVVRLSFKTSVLTPTR